VQEQAAAALAAAHAILDSSGSAPHSPPGLATAEANFNDMGLPLFLSGLVAAPPSQDLLPDAMFTNLPPPLPQQQEGVEGVEFAE